MPLARALQLLCCTVCVGRLLGRHCGSNLPASIDTSDSFAYVRFVTDSSGNAPGFSLSFEASVEGTVLFKRLLEKNCAQSHAALHLHGIYTDLHTHLHTVCEYCHQG